MFSWHIKCRSICQKTKDKANTTNTVEIVKVERESVAGNWIKYSTQHDIIIHNCERPC